MEQILLTEQIRGLEEEVSNMGAGSLYYMNYIMRDRQHNIDGRARFLSLLCIKTSAVN